MRRFIITGAPGAGKSAIVRRLELDGFSVVEEAATDVIAAAHAQGDLQPWTQPPFIDAIVNLQKARQLRASQQSDGIQFHDRSVVCTAALAVHLGYPFSPLLERELERIRKERTYQNQVFFVRNLGFVTPTEARRITFEDTLRFEKIHEQIYRGLGFDLVPIERGSVAERVGIIKAAIRSKTSDEGRTMELDVVLKRFETPDEVRHMTKGTFELVHIGGMTIGRATYEPGWKWSLHVGPQVGATRCDVEHVGFVVSGTATAAFDDGRVFELRAGNLFYIPPTPHDSWVVGDEPYVSLHFVGAAKYAK